MGKKFWILNQIIVLSALIGGLYGILHDQLTYTISPEYYTKFKFYQFELIHTGNEAIFRNPRIKVSIVGFLATWWMGLFIGIILGILGFIHTDSSQMFRTTMKALLVTMAVAFATGLIGLAYGKFYLTKTGVDWLLPQNLIHKGNFIAVGSMHNFSYAGGLAGLLTGIIYSIRQRKKQGPVKKQSPVKKQVPVKKQSPVKEQNPVKKQVPAKKQVSVKPRKKKKSKRK
jgi:hypothetical protein